MTGQSFELPTLGFGGAPIANLFSAVDPGTAARTIETALDGGVRYLDTAPFYGFGLSERRIGDAIRGRDDIVLSSKVGRLLRPGVHPDPASMGWIDPLAFHPVFDYSYAGVMRSYQDSLQRLGRDRIDLLYLHDIGALTHPDPDEQRRHFDDAMNGGYRALDELRRAGDIAGFGIGVNEIDVSLRTLEQGDWDVFLIAGRYTLLEQPALGALFDRCAERQVRVVVGGPFNSGILLGGDTWNYEAAPAAIRDRVAGLSRICAAHGVSLPAAALQFPLAHPVVASVIPGTRTPAKVKELLAWWKTDIPAGLWSDLKGEGLLDEAAPIPG